MNHEALLKRIARLELLAANAADAELRASKRVDELEAEVKSLRLLLCADDVWLA